MRAHFTSRLIICLYIIACTVPLNGQDFLKYNPHKITMLEFRSLPEHCQVRLYSVNREESLKDNDKFKYWKAQMGVDFVHIHHYCFGLVLMQRALKCPLDSMDRKYNFQYSIDEFDYVLDKVSESLPILPNIYLEKAKALISLGRTSEATLQMLKAEQLIKRKR